MGQPTCLRGVLYANGNYLPGHKKRPTRDCLRTGASERSILDSLQEKVVECLRRREYSTCRREATRQSRVGKFDGLMLARESSIIALALRIKKTDGYRNRELLWAPLKDRPNSFYSFMSNSFYSCQDFALRRPSLRWDELVEMRCPVTTHIGEGCAMPPVLTLGVLLQQS